MYQSGAHRVWSRRVTTVTNPQLGDVLGLYRFSSYNESHSLTPSRDPENGGKVKDKVHSELTELFIIQQLKNQKSPKFPPKIIISFIHPDNQSFSSQLVQCSPLAAGGGSEVVAGGCHIIAVISMNSLLSSAMGRALPSLRRWGCEGSASVSA